MYIVKPGVGDHWVLFAIEGENPVVVGWFLDRTDAEFAAAAFRGKVQADRLVAGVDPTFDDSQG